MSAIQYWQRRQRSMESQIQTTVSQFTPEVFYQPSGDPWELPILKLTEFLGDHLEWPDWAKILISLCIKRYQEHAVSENYPHWSDKSYNLWNLFQLTGILSSRKKFVRPRVKFQSQLKKIYTHPPFRHDDSSSIVRFANLVTNTIKNFDSTWISAWSGIGMSSEFSHRKIFPAAYRRGAATFTGQSNTGIKLDCIQSLVRIICLQTWCLVIPDKLQVTRPRKRKQVSLQPMLMILPNQIIQNIHSKLYSTPSDVAKKLGRWTWMNDENMCRR